MDIQAWNLLALVLLASANADHYEERSEKLYLTPSASPKPQNYESKEVVIYLTPRQIKAFKSNGAVVKFQTDPESQLSFGFQQQITEEQSEQNREKIISRQSDLENVEQQNQDFDLPKIVITTDGQKDPDGLNIKQTPYEVQVEEENSVPPRELSLSPFNNKSRSQREEKYVAPLVEQKKQFNYLFTPNQPNQRVQVRRFIPKQHESIVSEDNKEESQTDTLVGQKIYKLVPSAMASKSEEWSKEQKHKSKENSDKLNTLLSNHENVVKSIGQHVYKLVENEFQVQSVLHDLKTSTNLDDQKYALQVEKRRTNLEKEERNAPAAVVKSSPLHHIIKEEIINNNDVEYSPLVRRVPKPFKVNLPQHTASGVASVVVKLADTEKNVENTEPEKQVPDTSNIFLKVEDPSFEELVIPYEIKKEISITRPENLSIVRHVWEH